jgi:alpha-tubulin suppressor-like RCC1 family protein
VSILGDQKLPSGIIALQEKNAIHFKAISMGRAHILLLTDKNTVWGFGKDFIADDQCIQLVNGVAELRSELFNGYPVQISAGRNFSLILTNTNKLYSFGVNSYHQLGRKTDALVDQVDFSNAKIPLGMKIIQIQAGCDSATVIISQLGNVEQFVNNLHHQLLRRTEFSDLDLLVYE